MDFQQETALIDDGILEGQMERSNAREPVTKAVLRLLRKKRLVLL